MVNMNNLSEEETIKSFKLLMYNAKANWDYFSYEILFNFFSLYNNAIEEKDKIIEQMTYYIMNLDIDEDICKKVNCDTNSGELDCKDCIKQYFENRAKEIK